MLTCHRHYCMAVSSNPSGELAKITVPDLIMVNEMNCAALSILRLFNGICLDS